MTVIYLHYHLLAILPFFFIGAWLLSTTAIWLLSGWSRLQDHFPDRDEVPLERLRFQSAIFGRSFFGANYGSCLRFDVCRGGLRVAVWRVFAPWSRPFFVPWTAIRTEPKRYLGLPHYVIGFYRLVCGDPEVQSLILTNRAARRVAEASQGGFELPPLGHS